MALLTAASKFRWGRKHKSSQQCYPHHLCTVEWYLQLILNKCTGCQWSQWKVRFWVHSSDAVILSDSVLLSHDHRTFVFTRRMGGRDVMVPNWQWSQVVAFTDAVTHWRHLWQKSTSFANNLTLLFTFRFCLRRLFFQVWRRLPKLPLGITGTDFYRQCAHLVKNISELNS